MRVVSLVPSLTEAIAASVPNVLVGATRWCTHPSELDVVRVGGSKYPDLDRIIALRPDLVLVNVEENRKTDADRLRAAGIALHVTYPRTVAEALDELAVLLRRVGLEHEPAWLAAARAAWSAPVPEPTTTAVVPVWRRPWIVVGSDTFAGDVLRRLGIVNTFDDAAQRYPRPTLDEILSRRPDLVVLPDEPYAFSAADGPECFPGVPHALVSGRHLTWYGPSLADARDVLARQLGAPTR